MIDIINRKTLIDFYEGMEQRSFIMLFLMMLFSLGSFLILWIYNLNKRFEQFDSDKAPDSARGIIILFFMPVVWIIFMFILRLYIFLNNSFILEILRYIDMVGWSFIVFLALQYLYDFCKCFGKFTMTNGFIWYMFLWIGFFPLVLLPFGTFYFFPILIIPIITIPIMQFTINKDIERFDRGVAGSKFYTRGGENE